MHGASGAVKGCKCAVARVLYNTTPEPGDDPTGLGIVTVEDVVPQVVAGLRDHLRRLDDVGKEHRCQYPVDVAITSRRTGQEFLHRVECGGPLTGIPPTMHLTSKLNELCVPECGGHGTPPGNAHDGIVGAVYDERRRRNRWQYRSGVDGHIRSHDLDNEAWRRTGAFVPSQLFEDRRGRWSMDEGSEELACAPIAFDEVEKARHVEIGACRVVLGKQASEGPVEHEALDPLWKRCCEQEGERSTLRDSDQMRTFPSRGVHHHSDVIGTLGKAAKSKIAAR